MNIAQQHKLAALASTLEEARIYLEVQMATGGELCPFDPNAPVLNEARRALHDIRAGMNLSHEGADALCMAVH